jgi:hypothetical protein
MKLTVFLSVSALLTSGCATGINNLNKSSNYALQEGEAAIVIGLKPSYLQIVMDAGAIVDGRFEIPSRAKPVAVGQAKDDYLVIKAKPGDVLAISSIARMPSSSQLLGQRKIFCGGETVYAFKVPKSGVFYLADFNLRETNKSLSIDFAVNLDAAKKFFTEHMKTDAIQTIPIISVPSGAYCVSHVSPFR